MNINPDFEKLSAKIMLRIRKEQKILAIKRAFIFSLTAISSAVVFIFALKMVGDGVAESGFLQFFSLLFSDFRIVIIHWKSFVFSLLESLPAMGLVILCVAVFGFFGSLKFLTKDIKFVIKKPLLINN